MKQQAIVSFLVKQASYLVCLALIDAIILGAAQFVAIGHDWGFHLIERFHPCTEAQGNTEFDGAMLLRYVITPVIAAGIGMGYLEAQFGGKLRWRLGIPLSLAAALAILDVHDSEAFVPAFLAASSSILISFPFCTLYKELQKRTQAPLLVSAIVLPFGVSLITTFSLSKIDPVAEFIAYNSSLLAAAFLIPHAVHVKTKQAVALATLLGTLPVTLFNLANITFVAVCTAGWLPGWSGIGLHAFASAMSITLMTAVITFLPTAFTRARRTA